MGRHTVASTVTYESQTLRVKHADFDHMNFHWTESGQSNTKIIVAIHGTPGGWGAWQAFIEHPGAHAQYRILAIDRPGWGKSQFDDNRVISSISEQKQLIQAWYDTQAERFKDADVYLMGHSWGAPVAAKLLADHPDYFAGGVLIAGPFDPQLSGPRWYHRWAKTKLVKAVIGDSLARSNQEMLVLQQQLSILHSSWPEITQPTIIMQGHKDFLVDHENADFLAEALATAEYKLIKLKQKGHFFVFNDPGLIFKALDFFHHDNVARTKGTFFNRNAIENNINN